MKREVSYGLYYGGFSILWVLVMNVTELNRSGAAGLLKYVDILVLIYIVKQRIREVQMENGGYINFSKSFKNSLIISSIGSSLSSVYFYLQIKFIDTSYIDFVLNKLKTEMSLRLYTEDMVKQGMTILRKTMTPEHLFISTLAGSIFISFVLSFIIAFIMNKPNPNKIA